MKIGKYHCSVAGMHSIPSHEIPWEECLLLAIDHVQDGPTLLLHLQSTCTSRVSRHTVCIYSENEGCKMSFTTICYLRDVSTTCMCGFKYTITWIMCKIYPCNQAMWLQCIYCHKCEKGSPWWCQKFCPSVLVQDPVCMIMGLPPGWEAHPTYFTCSYKCVTNYDDLSTYLSPSFLSLASNTATTVTATDRRCAMVSCIKSRSTLVMWLGWQQWHMWTV